MKQKLITILELRKQQFVSHLQQVKQRSIKTATRIGAVFRKAGRSIASIKMPSIGGFGQWMGITAVLGSITAAFVKTTQWAADLEQTTVAFETMMGSAEKAKQMVQELTDFSTVTPFEPGEVYEGGRALLSYGVAAKSVTREMRMIGDVASGVKAPLGDMVNIYGKAMMKGKLQTEELNQLAERGIPIIQTLADKYGVTGDAIYTMASNGEIKFKDLQDALQAMTEEGGIYFKSMAKQSETLGGLISTTMGNIKNIGAAIADGWVPALKAAALWTNSVASAMQKANELKKQNKIKEEGGDGWLKSTTKFMGDMVTLGNADNIANRVLGSREVLSMEGDPKAKAYADRKRQERAQGITSPTAPEVAAAKEADAAKAAADDKQRRINNSINKTVLDKIGGSGSSTGDKRQAFIDKFIKAAEKIASGSGSKLSSDKRSEINNKAGALYDKNFEAGASGKYSSALKGMKDKLAYQTLIVAGKKKEAEITKAIAAAEKSMGRKMTADELAAYKQVTGDNYDLKNQDKDKVNIKDNPKEQFSDRLLKIGGMIGGTADSKNIDKEKVSILKTIAKNTADIKIEGGIEIA